MLFMGNSSLILTLEEAIAEAGSAGEFAKRLGVTAQAVSLWRKGGRISPERAIDIENATAGKVRRSDLRPDLWPREQPTEAAE